MARPVNYTARDDTVTDKDMMDIADIADFQLKRDHVRKAEREIRDKALNTAVALDDQGVPRAEIAAALRLTRTTLTQRLWWRRQRNATQDNGDL